MVRPASISWSARPIALVTSAAVVATSASLGRSNSVAVPPSRSSSSTKGGRMSRGSIPVSVRRLRRGLARRRCTWSPGRSGLHDGAVRSEEHTSELQSLMRISYAVFCLKKKKHSITQYTHDNRQVPILLNIYCKSNTYYYEEY